MTIRKSWILAILVVVATYFAYSYVSNGKKRMTKNKGETLKVALVETVKNQKLPLTIDASGQLRAKNTFELYSEVTGVLKNEKKEFRTGTIYRKGEIMIRVDDTEAKAQLFSQRSDFMNTVTGILPDIKIEFPSEFEKWKSYLKDFEIEKSIMPLPEVSSDKEKYFVSGKKIFTQFYSIKNLEARYAKYILRAPFNGIVTQTDINPGGLVRSGQKIGVFSNMDIFELEVSVKASDMVYIAVGDDVDIFSHDGKKLAVGKISRINEAIDLNSQTVSVFVETKGKALKAGMYLDVEIQSDPVENALLIERDILHNNTFVYLVKDSILVEKRIEAVKFNKKTVLVNNFTNGDKLVMRNISGAYPGMKVIPKKIK